MTTFIVSYPRSGQHLLESLLREILSTEFTYCEYYSCCRHIPCSRGHCFQKNHDLHNCFPIRDNAKYIVLYRSDPIEQLEACYRFFQCNKPHRTYHLDLATEFCRKNLPKYERFVQKWVTPSSSSPSNNIHPIAYRDLVDHPVETLLGLLAFLYPTRTFDPNTIQRICSSTLTVDDGRRKKVQSRLGYQHILSEESKQYIRDRL